MFKSQNGDWKAKIKIFQENVVKAYGAPDFCG